MIWIDNMLKRFGIFPNFTKDDILNAENEEDLRVHTRVVHEVSEAIGRRVAGNRALRHAIDQAKQRTNSLAEFEQRIRGDFN